MAKKNPVVVVDYGLGNLFSIARALQRLGAEAVLSADPKTVSAAAKVILPGVGAFGDGMKGLTDNGLVEPLREFGRSGRPILGICLGLQLLMDEGAEFGFHQGLGLVRGRAVAFPRPVDRKVKIPTWAGTGPPAAARPSRRAWRGRSSRAQQGLLLLFHPLLHRRPRRPAGPSDTEYAGTSFCSVVGQEHLGASSTEKSGHPASSAPQLPGDTMKTAS